jgi:hypothetical protein
MPNDEPTLPPHAPNTLRTWLPRIGAWIAAHPKECAMTAALVFAFVLGAWAF